ncbi:MAG: hypothetical protein KAS05_01010 [Candidatus Omnitrophica bacterium]|nr:hypothetical protein [Candidatus Omnitrophota bacterium]
MGVSKSAHALVKEHFKDHTFDDVKNAINKIPVICLNVFWRVSEIVNIECPKNFKEILECARDGKRGVKGIKNTTQRNLGIGDLVTTDGSDVAEILEAYISS